MAVAKSAILAGAERLGPRARRLEFEMHEGEALGFVGGQYVIVDSGIVLPGGKVAKRAYSMASSDAEQKRFELVVRRLEEGPGSNYMHELPVGSVLKFSGPWGKFVASDGNPEGPTLVLATDTGITAALGLLQARTFRSLLAGATLVWFVSSDDDFVPETFVRARLPPECASYRVERLPSVGHPERGLVARAHLRRLGAPARAYLAGDGKVMEAMTDALRTMGVTDAAIAVECFFNNPSKKAA